MGGLGRLRSVCFWFAVLPMSRLLTFVKHARPEKLDQVDSHHWPLSAQGREDTRALAGILKQAASGGGERAARYVAVASSEEPKALETAQILSGELGLPLEVSAGLGEHDRSNVPMMRTPEFVSAMADLFKRPDQLVLGRESARHALKRFERAVYEVLDLYPATPADAAGDGSCGDLLIVSHGTVLALWVSAWCELDGYTTWRQMGLPSYVSVMWPECRIVGRRDSLDQPRACAT